MSFFKQAANLRYTPKSEALDAVRALATSVCNALGAVLGVVVGALAGAILLFGATAFLWIPVAIALWFTAASYVTGVGYAGGKYDDQLQELVDNGWEAETDV